MMEFEGLAQMLATGQCTAELTQMLSDPYYLQRRLALGSYHDLLHELDVCEVALQELVSHERVERRSTAADSGISHCCRTLIFQSHVLPTPRHTTSLTHCLLPMHCTAYSSSKLTRGILFFSNSPQSPPLLAAHSRIHPRPRGSSRGARARQESVRRTTRESRSATAHCGRASVGAALRCVCARIARVAADD